MENEIYTCFQQYNEYFTVNTDRRQCTVTKNASVYQKLNVKGPELMPFSIYQTSAK